MQTKTKPKPKTKTEDKTKRMNIKISQGEYEHIKDFAKLNGKTVSILMLDAVREQMELWEDLRDIEEYEQEKAKGTLETTPWEEIKGRLGL